MIDITETMESCLPADVLCFLCKNFLSVTPILIDSQGNNICGRCESDISAGLFQRNIFYERCANQFWFPCRFAKEGCFVKRRFGEAKCHEGMCPYQTVKCEYETCVWCGIPTELIIHYNKCHSKLVVEDNRFEKELVEGDSYCIIVTEGLYFLIKWSYFGSNMKIEVKSLYLLNSECEISIKYTISSEGETAQTSGFLELNRIATLTLQDFQKAALLTPTPVLFSLQTILPVTTNEKKEKRLNIIKCPNCACQMKPPILRCSSGHLTCLECSGMDYDFCEQCSHLDETRFYRVPELEMLTISSIYKCKWKDCGENFSVREIESHEQSCSKRVYSCLHCSEWKGLLNELVLHDSVCVYKETPHLLIDTEVTVLGVNIAELEYSLLAYKELFFVTFSPIDTGIEVAVVNCASYSVFGWYRYEAFLHHTKELNCLFNKNYRITGKAGSRYLFEVPNKDILNFGGSEFYKITVKIYLLTGSDRSQNVAKHFRWFQ